MAFRAFVRSVVFPPFSLAVSDAHTMSAKYQNQKPNPCASNGRHAGLCPGYVIDHIEPLCAGGRDHESNIQWPTIAEAKIRDREAASRAET